MKIPNFDLKAPAASKNETEEPEHIERVDIKSFDEIDLSSELLTLYNNASHLFRTVEQDRSVPPNQKAQVLNSIRAIQEQVLRSQERLFNVQKLKLIETTLIETLKTYPDLKESFLQAYEKAALDSEKRLESTQKGGK